MPSAVIAPESSSTYSAAAEQGSGVWRIMRGVLFPPTRNGLLNIDEIALCSCLGVSLFILLSLGTCSETLTNLVIVIHKWSSKPTRHGQLERSTSSGML